MACPKKIFFYSLFSLAVLAWSVSPQPVYASRSQYYDYGPYYQQPQVLGLSFSALENLPAPKIPDSIGFSKAGGLLPGNPFYSFERIGESFQLAVTLDAIKKEELRLSFAGERLAEAKALAEQGKGEAASQALADYNRTLSETAGTISRLARDDGARAKVLAEKIEQGVAAQAVIGQTISFNASPALAKDWSSTAEASREVLDRIADARGERPVSEELSQSLQELKQEGLLTEEESGKLYGLTSRSEVRDELNKLASSGQFPVSELHKLDAAVAKYYPESAAGAEANLQVAELRVYQTLPQPSKEVQNDLERWRRKPDDSPPNTIKPYLWYNRAQALAREVDLSNFTSQQQAEVARSYPIVANNPTYLPSPGPQTASQPNIEDQTASPSAVEEVPEIPAEKFLGEVGGVLPGDPLYLLKSLGEEVGVAFSFDPAERAEARMRQAERRLAEAGQLSKDPKRAKQYESTIRNYQKAMASAAELIRGAGDSKAAEDAAEKLEAQAARHEIVLERGLLPPPSNNPQLISEVIKSTEDAMDVSADTLNRPALPPALSSRLEDLKAQGLILSEEAEDLTRSSSRQEVREKVRKLVEVGSFPPADAKKLDETQSLISPSDYNQLVEVRKVEELQNLRAVQAELAKTPTLKQQVSQLDQEASSLGSSFDPSLIKPEDLGGRENLVKAYEKLAVIPRPINGGQFGAEATPGAQPKVSPPSPRDAVLTTCPEGATFKRFEGCVWADSGRKINDYDQYKCDGPRQYYSFAAKKCVAYDSNKGYQEDTQPICPVGYQWSWPTQSCQTSRGGILPYPSPSAEPEPKDDKEREERSKSCPEGSSYKPPKGCVWDDSGKSVYDPEQYRCGGPGQYYSFKEQKCVASPKAGQRYPDDSAPLCKEPGTFWNWSAGKCLPLQELQDQQGVSSVSIDEIKPSFVAPGNPFYFLKQATEAVQQITAFTPQAKEQVSMAQAEERLAEAADALKKDDQQGAKKSIAAYTATMQGLVADLSKESLTEAAKKEIGKRLSESAVEQNLILQKLQALSTEELDTPISAAVSVSILGVDKAADIAGEPPIPDEVKSKIEALPEKMISEEDKKALLGMNSRVDARLQLGSLITNGALTQTDASFLNEEFDKIDPEAKTKVEELKKLEEIATASESKEKLVEKVEKNEEIARKLAEFEKTFEVGKEVPADVRPYVRLTRINEVAQTIRPDAVRLEDFQNRKDVLLAVATLQEEFKPTKEAWKRVEEFRRRNPDRPLPIELARIEALSYKLGVRDQAGPCYLPTPPFPANTPCPAPGAAIPIASYTNYANPFPLIVDPVDSSGRYIGYGNAEAPSVDKDGKPLVYGQGPKPENAGVCPDGYHWMYDSGGWCMSNSGSYSSSYNYTPTGPQTPGYTPYSQYYNAPGAPPATYGYPVGDNSPNDGCPYGYDSDGRGNCIPNSYPSSNYSYSAPGYYGSASTYYTTNPPAGTVPGSGPKPTAPGQCPSGFHWMSDSGGWCMADGPTYVPSGGAPASSYPVGTATSSTPPAGGYNCGSQPYDPVTKRCKDGACPGGFNWDGSKCVAGGYSGGGGSWPGTTYYGTSPTNCGSGYYWNGYSCQPSSGTGSNCTYPSGGCPGVGAWYDYSSCSCKTSTSSYSGYYSGSSYPSCGSGYSWSGSGCQPSSSTYSGSWPGSSTTCSPPSGGCGSSSYWDYGSCSCRSSGIYSGGYPGGPGAPFPGISSSGGGAYGGGYDASGRYVGGSYGGYDSAGNYVGTGGGSSSGGSSTTSSCSPPSGGCGSGWWDSGSCSCKQASSQGCYNVSASSCPSGWYFDSSVCTCRQSSTSSGSSGSTTTSSGGGSSSGSCPSGYHWMSDGGGYCMQDGGGSTSTSGGGSTSTSTPTTTTTTSSPPPSEPAPSTTTTTTESSPPPPSEPAPAPSTSTTTESSPPPSP